MRLILHLLGVEVLDLQLGRSAYVDIDEESTSEDSFDVMPDANPLVQEVGRPADALTGFYQPPYYEDPPEDRRRR